MEPWSDGSPFAFLTSLSGDRETDREIVEKTRSEDLKISGHMALASKVATLYAFSGNGKTSLIDAGLIPFFLGLGYAVFKTRPRPPFALGDPVTAFKECCIRNNWLPPPTASETALLDEARRQLQQRSADDIPAVRRLVEQLDGQLVRLAASTESRGADFGAYLRRHTDSSISSFLGSAQRFLGNAPMIVICDQFEEIFVHYYNTPELSRFIQELREACDNPSLRIHLLFSMREDWVGSMIAFRDAIPDIFSSSYRLDPIRRSRAGAALTLPLKKVSCEIGGDVTERMLNDLADFYRRQQKSDSSAIHLMPSPPDDPFIELPALQALGDRLWRTRTSQEKPFSLEHYESLASKNASTKSGSAAAAVLDSYLDETLSSISDDNSTKRLLDDMRLDLLYVLTDKEAHRKALGEGEMLAELRRIRMTTLNGHVPTQDEVAEALTKRPCRAPVGQAG